MKNKILVALSLTILCLAGSAQAQIANPYPPLSRQVAAPIPKLALLGAVGVTKGRTQYHKVTLTVTNRDKFSQQMFDIPEISKLPPNPCAASKTRIVAAVYSDLGKPLSKCSPISARDSLGEIAFLILKGSAIPNYVYLVLSDLQTGAAYRSNLVSPSTGATK